MTSSHVSYSADGTGCLSTYQPEMVKDSTSRSQGRVSDLAEAVSFLSEDIMDETNKNGITLSTTTKQLIGDASYSVDYAK